MVLRAFLEKRTPARAQCAAGVHFIRWLRRSECVVDNPEDANLFLFPYYDTCYKAAP